MKAFTQGKDFQIGTRVKAMVYKERGVLTKGVLLYVTSVLNKYSKLYSYNYVLNNKRLNRTELKLPITPEGTPDYEYMESYIKHIAYTYRMNRRDEQEEEIRMLREMV